MIALDVASRACCGEKCIGFSVLKTGFWGMMGLDLFWLITREVRDKSPMVGMS